MSNGGPPCRGSRPRSLACAVRPLLVVRRVHEACQKSSAPAPSSQQRTCKIAQAACRKCLQDLHHSAGRAAKYGQTQGLGEAHVSGPHTPFRLFTNEWQDFTNTAAFCTKPALIGQCGRGHCRSPSGWSAWRTYVDRVVASERRALGSQEGNSAGLPNDATVLPASAGEWDCGNAARHTAAGFLQAVPGPWANERSSCDSGARGTRPPPQR